MQEDEGLNSIYEYETITDQKLIDAVRDEKSLQKYFTSSFEGIKANQFCGILNIEDRDYYILPKIADSAELFR